MIDLPSKWSGEAVLVNLYVKHTLYDSYTVARSLFYLLKYCCELTRRYHWSFITYHAALIQVALEPLPHARVPQPPHRFGLDLTGTLAGNPKCDPDFLKRAPFAVH